MHTYINYAHFEQQVHRITGESHYEQYKHVLPQVNLVHRERFLQTLNCCEDIVRANTFVTEGMQLPDHRYSRYIKFILGKANSNALQLH